MLSFGQLSIDNEKKEVKVNGIVVEDITLREFEVLKYLVMHEGQVCTKEMLLEEIWGSKYFGDIRTVDVTMRRIKNKIEVDETSPQIIKYQRGRGYYLSDGENSSLAINKMVTNSSNKKKGKNVKFRFGEQSIELEDEIADYFKYYYEFKIDAIKTINIIKNEIKKINIENWKDLFENIRTFIDYTTNEKAQYLVQELSKYNIFKKNIDDYKRYNNAYRTISEFIEYANNLDKEVANRITYDSQKALAKAQSQITGNPYGIITSSYSSMAAYQISDIFERSSQRKAAQKEYEREIDFSTKRELKNYNKGCYTLLVERTMPKLIQDIDNYYLKLFKEYIKNLQNINIVPRIEVGIDRSSEFRGFLYTAKRGGIYFDKQKATELFEDFEVKTNKENLILEAIKLYPISVIENNEVLFYMLKSDMHDETIRLINFTKANEYVFSVLDNQIIEKYDIYKFKEIIKNNSDNIKYMSEVSNKTESEIIKEYCQLIYNRINKEDIINTYSELMKLEETINYICFILKVHKHDLLNKKLTKIIENNNEKIGKRELPKYFQMEFKEIWDGSFTVGGIIFVIGIIIAFVSGGNFAGIIFFLILGIVMAVIMGLIRLGILWYGINKDNKDKNSKMYQENKMIQEYINNINSN